MSAEDPERSLSALGAVITRRPFAYATSWPIEELTLDRPGGAPLNVLVKRHAGVVQKPAELLDPEREATVYRLLADAGLPAAALYGAGPGWLALEAVDAVPLWQSGKLQDWRRTAGWAATVHEHYAAHPPPREHLLVHDRSHFETIIARAGVEAELERAAQRAMAVVLGLPVTLVHGELYPANVLVNDERVVAVDWEMAAVGSGVMDLAALTTGFEAGRRSEIVEAYGGCPGPHLAAARLLLALQWLGWWPGWNPPPEHQRDWLTEAQAAAGELV